MTLENKLLCALGIFGLTLVVVICTFFWNARDSGAKLQTVLVDRVVPLRDLKLVADSYAVLIVDSAHKARNGNLTFPVAAQEVERGRRDLKKAWLRYSATQMEGDEKRLAQQAAISMKRADRSVDRLVMILRRDDRADLDRFVVNELYPSIDPVSTDIGKLVELQIDLASSTTTEALANSKTAMATVFGLGFLGIMVLAGALFVVTRKVVAPITALARMITGLAQGGGDARLPDLERRDEIGDISRAVDAFLATIMTKERNAAASASAIQTLVTSNLSVGLTALAKGDLTHQIQAEFPESYVVLKDNFNETVNSLSTLISAIATGTAAISSGSSEIAHASEDLARRTESNAASLEETNAALVRIDDRLKATALSSSETVARADQAITTVVSGRATAEEAVAAMGRVSDSAKGIDSVIEGLDKIAFQTRVLAMNAAVEAGRAGDAGRGFAVVADLVSALAMRAEEEAKRARDQLMLTQANIITAVQAVENVDGALGNISGDVGCVHKLLGTMADDANAQSALITEIAAAIGAMDQSTQQNAAMVEQTSAAARNLSGEVSVLADQASRFKAAHADRGGSADRYRAFAGVAA